MPTDDPHADLDVAQRGTPPDRAAAAVVLIHGRGASAAGMLDLADALGRPGVAYLAPQAAGFTWYPHSFLAPLRHNEPDLGSALRAVGQVLARVEAHGIARERTLLVGFSQGACLAAEYAARHPDRYGAVVALSGGLIGAPGARDEKGFDYDGDLRGTPVLLGCSDVDPHIPVERVHTTRHAFERMGAEVDARIYPGMGHTVNPDEMDAVRALIDAVTGGGDGAT